MASPLKLVIALAFIWCHFGHGKSELSEHYTEVIISIGSKINSDTSNKCLDAFKTFLSLNSDALLDTSCIDIKNDQSKLEGPCTASEYKDIKDIFCNEVKDSNKDRLDRLAKYKGVYSKLSKACQNKAGNGGALTTWYAFEELCDKIENKDKENFEKSCPKDEYGDLKQVVCGASAIMSGMVSLAVGVLASIFTKM